MSRMAAVDESCDESNAMGYLTQIEVGAKIARLRDERDVAQRRLAAEIGLDPSALSRVESGERGLAVGELVAIAKILDVSMDELLRDDVAEGHRCFTTRVAKPLGTTQSPCSTS